jgi:thymidylate kinase
VPRPAAEFIYILVKICAKGKAAAPYFDRLRQLHAEAPAECQQLFARLFGPQAGNAPIWWEESARDWRELNQWLHQRNQYHGRQFAAEAQRIARRLRHPTGFTVAFLGPDGVGKSTVIQAVENWGRICFRRQMRIHFNPRFGRPRASAPVTNPQGQTPRSPLMSIGKLCYYFGRHLVHWLVKQLPARRAATLIIFDRTFVDLLIDPRRYRIRGGAGLTKCLGRWLPQPDLYVILDAPASVVHRRKSELSAEEIERQRDALLQLARDWPNAVVVSADQPVEAVAHQAVAAILDRLVARQKSFAAAK